MKDLLYIGILKSLFKGYSTFYLLLLPIYYTLNIINSFQLGYIGTLLIAGTFFSGIILSLFSHKFDRKALLTSTLILILLSNILLLINYNDITMILSYFLAGLGLGIGVITTDEISGHLTTQGDRYSSFANLAMLQDLARIIYPILIGTVYAIYSFRGLYIFMFIVLIITTVLVLLFMKKDHLKTEEFHIQELKRNPFKLLKENKPFSFVVLLEFIDSFASSQLFVFLPTLLIFKNFSLEFALGLQSIVFLGYFTGRWAIGLLAKKFNGYIALAISEIGMVITIVLLLIFPPSIVLYILCYLLGIFARGTSPVIKAMVFDRLDSSERKLGTPIYTMIGDTGSATGQLAFGLLVGAFGIISPFIGSASAAGLVALLCLLPIVKPSTSQ